MQPTLICALADDDRRNDVRRVARALAKVGSFRVLYAHVAEPAIPPPTAYGFAPGGAAASAYPGELAERARRDGERMLSEALGADDETLVAVGAPAEELVRLAEEYGAGLLVVGTHGRGPIAGAMLGSVSRTLARRGPCPVLLVPEDAVLEDGGAVVCGVAPDTDHGDQVVVTAARLADLLDSPLVLAHALGGAAATVAAPAGGVPAFHVEPSSREHIAARRRLVGVARRLELGELETVSVEGPPGAALSTLAERRRARMLVVGCRGGGLVRTALGGSVSLDLARSAHRPVVVVPAQSS